ncbi:2-aminoadipate transaminase [Clostridium magnum DSM 2767]|uniref:2-aminoadipate transaminase n=1 Tax=Clostridium magnum DSM 2767 TaxID=1121326 RepID=A0A161XBW0_9CLOT|nr:aminotransferase class I/II-fold pyridoxal phosphate-dependent enzyme [Clostridium magnum]KZL91786.1 2-aminoadipate transaminase [Clostridium magnum DSM 2767]SHI25977.1 Aminotransferase class I and II [Clostridium magnum DSM 2767]
MKPEELDAQCKLNNIQGIYLVPSCNNPTAILMNMERRREIAKIIKKNNLLLIEDAIYSFLAPQNYLPITSFIPEQSIYINSTSKSLCSGLRVAFMVYPEKYSSEIIRGVYNINIKTPALNTEIIAELINTGMADRIIEEKLLISKERNEIYKKYFQIENPNENQDSFFRLISLKQRFDADQFEKKALSHGIRIYHSNRFLVGNHDEKQFLRVSLSSTANSSELEKGLSILKDILLDPTDSEDIHSLII